MKSRGRTLIYRVQTRVEGRQIYVILSHFPPCSSQTQKNGGNSVTVATKCAYVHRQAADGEGRRDREGRRRMKWLNKRIHTRGCTASDFFFFLMIFIFQVLLHSIPLSPLSLLVSPLNSPLCSRATHEGRSNTTCILWRSCGNTVQSFLHLFSLAPLARPLSYLFTAVCSSTDCFSEDMSGLLLSPALVFV